MANSTRPPVPDEALRSLVSAFRLARSAERRLKGKGGWTQADAAKWWGCSERTWRRYETGPGRPPLALIKRIAKASKTG